MDLDSFLDKLRNLEENEIVDFCRKYVLHGTPYIFQNREDEYYEFRKRISENFKVAFYEVFITRSAKLGLSYYKRKQFDYDSDIDIAIVSNSLYEAILDKIYEYQIELRQNRKKITFKELNLYHEFLEYTALGWIRPDKLPTSFQIEKLKQDWFDFFKTISYNRSEVGNYKVVAGIFKSYSHFEKYTINGLKNLKNKLYLDKKMKIKLSINYQKIVDLYKEMLNESLCVKPIFQRKFVWTQEHEEQFIETILKEYPFPEIYVCQGEIDPETKEIKREVIDGQTRLVTIKKYIEGVSKKPFKKVPNYQELTEEEKQNFLNYQVVIRDIGKVDNQTVREIFRRINLTQFTFNDFEIDGVIYNGEFIQTANSILEKIGLEKFGVFSESQLTRMADLHFILLVMSTLENGGYFARDDELEIHIASFNEEYPNSKEIENLIINTFKIIENFNLKPDTIWFRKSNFFTMVVEIAKSNFDNINLENLREKLIDFEKQLMENKDKSNDFGKYYQYIYSGTNSRKARVIRGEIFNKYIYNKDMIDKKLINTY